MPVYAIQAGDGGPVKIGVAADVEKRVRQLQTGQSARLRVLHVWQGDRGMERELHRRLAGHHVGGEWFAPVPALLDGSIIHGITPPKAKPASPLKLWREARGLTLEAAAAPLGVTGVTFNRWELGEREPDFAAMAAIEDMTGGAITPNMLVAWWRSCQRERVEAQA